jgi:hypothetical protein
LREGPRRGTVLYGKSPPASPVRPPGWLADEEPGTRIAHRRILNGSWGVSHVEYCSRQSWWPSRHGPAGGSRDISVP